MKNETKLINYLNTKEHIYLYGAGLIGGLVKQRLFSNGLGDKVECFVKTAAEENEKYLNLKIYSLDAIKQLLPNSCVLLCALSNVQKEMCGELEKRSIYEYVRLSNELLQSLEEKYISEKKKSVNKYLNRKYDIMFFSQDNNATSGAFISMTGLCSEIQKQTDYRIIVVLPRYGDGEKLLEDKGLDYTYEIRRTTWIKEFNEKTQDDPEYSIYNEAEITLLKELIHQFDIKLVHISGMFVYAGAIAAKEIGIPVVWHIRENIFTQGNHFINKSAAYNLLNKSDAVICVSKHVADAYDGLDAHVTRIIYNGVSENQFYYNNSKKWGEQLSIVMVGHITRLKGQETLIRAMGYLDKSCKLIPHVKFVGGCDAQYKEYLSEIINSEKLGKYIEFVGRTDRPEQYYKEADIAVSATCGGEGFDRVRIEAMLAGCLLITNDAGAAREIIVDGDTGFLYISGDANSLADVIQKAMNDKQKAKKIAENGQLLCMKRFTKKYNAEQVCLLYEKILDK